MHVNRLIICGSPRARGRSAALCEAIRWAYEDACPDDRVDVVMLSDVHIAPCTGCDVCRRNVPGRDELYCIIADDMVRVRRLLNECDQLVVVTPVYFAGVPAQFKSFLDRLQPYFWTNRRQERKRPADLHVVGEGGDPHGFGPLVGTVRSALAVAGLRLDTVHDWVGLIPPDGSVPEGTDVLTGGRVHPALAYTCSGPDGVHPRAVEPRAETATGDSL